MSKEKLLKLNEEYKLLKSLQFCYYFKFNKLKSTSIFFSGLFLLSLLFIFFGFFNNVYISELSETYNVFFVKSFFFIFCFFILFILNFLIYMQAYSFIQFLKQRHIIKDFIIFNSYEEYSNYLKTKQSEAKNLLKELKNEK